MAWTQYEVYASSWTYRRYGVPGWLSSTVAQGGFLRLLGTFLEVQFRMGRVAALLLLPPGVLYVVLPSWRRPHGMVSVGLGTIVSPVSPPLRIRHG